MSYLKSSLKISPSHYSMDSSINCICNHIIAGWCWKIWKSVGVMIPNIWKVIQLMFQTTNQIWFNRYFLPYTHDYHIHHEHLNICDILWCTWTGSIGHMPLVSRSPTGSPVEYATDLAGYLPVSRCWKPPLKNEVWWWNSDGSLVGGFNHLEKY